MSFLRNAILLAAMAASPAMANEIFASQPKTVSNALQALGYRAVASTDDSGNPMIESGIDGVDYTIWFYDCEAGQNCLVLELQSRFIVDAPVSAESMNAWNRDNLFGTGFMADDGAAALSLTITTVGGLTTDNFNDAIGLWENAIVNFKTHIGF